MSEKLSSKDLINESLDEEMERKGTSPYPDWLNVKKQVSPVCAPAYHEAALAEDRSIVC